MEGSEFAGVLEYLCATLRILGEFETSLKKIQDLKES